MLFRSRQELNTHVNNLLHFVDGTCVEWLKYRTSRSDNTSGFRGISRSGNKLLAIARAAVADPPVLIIDEATSSIDTRTEALVQKGMDALMKGRTSFVIAHRLSTVRDADCIMVLEQGRIIERGTHQQLLEQRGRYYQLYTGNQIEAE